MDAITRRSLHSLVFCFYKLNLCIFQDSFSCHRQLSWPWPQPGFPSCRPTGQKMRSPYHITVGRHNNWGQRFVLLTLRITSTCFLRRGPAVYITHPPASFNSELKCYANYCMTLLSVSVLGEIHNLWRILLSASKGNKCHYPTKVRSDWAAAISVAPLKWLLQVPLI